MSLMKNKHAKVHIAKVVREDAPINIGNLSVDAAIEHLQRFKKTQEEAVNATKEFRCFPWDGARAWAKVLERECGWVNMEKTPGFFGPTPPSLRNVEVAPGVFEAIPWGRMTVPNIEGYFQTGASQTPNGLVFRISSLIKRKYEFEAKRLFDLVQTQLETDSIYRGKTVRLSFHDDDGERYDEDNIHMIQPQFVDLSRVDPTMLVFTPALERMVKSYLFTHIKYRDACRELDVPGKRGTIFHGVPGTGKTLTMMIAAQMANENGISVFYADSVIDFESTLKAALTHLPALVICEDIDRITKGGRDIKMDKLLNYLDGIATKTADLSVILTSNNLASIEKTVLRPGRVDLVLHCTPPDTVAVERLLRLYTGRLLAKDANLFDASKVLAGQIPAVIREVVNRAKLGALERALGDPQGLQINGTDLADAALSIVEHMALLNRPEERRLEEKNQVLLEGLGSIATAITTLAPRKSNGAAEDGYAHP
jgi:transitional endoplasmic reticulum ATPase